MMECMECGAATKFIDRSHKVELEVTIALWMIHSF